MAPKRTILSKSDLTFAKSQSKKSSSKSSKGKVDVYGAAAGLRTRKGTPVEISPKAIFGVVDNIENKVAATAEAEASAAGIEHKDN